MKTHRAQICLHEDTNLSPPPFHFSLQFQGELVGQHRLNDHHCLQGPALMWDWARKEEYLCLMDPMRLQWEAFRENHAVTMLPSLISCLSLYSTSV